MFLFERFGKTGKVGKFGKAGKTGLAGIPGIAEIAGIRKKNPELEELLAKVSSNMANNYKDAAQKEFVLYQAKLKELREGGLLSEKQLAYYEECEARLREKLQGFTHKDQKPYWH